MSRETHRRRNPAVAPGDAEHLYRVGEVLERSGVSRQTFYNYIQMGLIKEADTSKGGHRLFDEHVFARIRMIRALNRTGYSLRDLRDTFSPFREEAQ